MVPVLVLLQGKEGSILSSPTREGSMVSVLVLLQGMNGSSLSYSTREEGFHF